MHKFDNIIIILNKRIIFISIYIIEPIYTPEQMYNQYIKLLLLLFVFMQIILYYIM
jgi:hypothetical protein